ncbi:uncharacterized protein LOC114364662 isoform X2 [Ostrinia furnacalis]|uniref:uncharacterized protein LOC114364662 isoform X2 n=1 Tax=Ostrinia furnacalis TaxID=93504 RepID=UPI00103B0A5C|nr:uncharacterized protein LOC114364662 isoform X2 [Ostrinia furnacalis]
MCTGTKCCYLELPIAGYVLGVVHIIWSLYDIIANFILMSGSGGGGEHGRKKYRMMVIGPINKDAGDGSSGASKPQIIGEIVVSVIAIIFSILLIIGIKKGKKIFVTCYYIFGIVLTIFLCLGAILMFVQGQIIMAISALIITVR